MNPHDNITLKEWCVQAGEALDYAYLVWLAIDGLKESNGRYYLNFTRGYVDLKTGHFVPQGKPKWRRASRGVVHGLIYAVTEHDRSDP